MAETLHNQTVAQMTSLTEALATIGRTVEQVGPTQQDLTNALGFTLAADAGPDNARRLAGSRLRRVDIAVLASLKIERVAIRAPRVQIVHAVKSSNAIDTICAMISGAVAGEGGMASIAAMPLDEALHQRNHDAVIAIGGDSNQRVLEKMGQVEFDSISLNPGRTIAFGNADARPVLLCPERIEPALATWLTIGRRLLARLAFRLIEEQPYLLELARPVTSIRGYSEIIPVRRRAAQVEPLAGSDWTAQILARADGWILVPAESDGFPAGTKVQMRPWP